MAKSINIYKISENDTQPLHPMAARAAHQAYRHKQYRKFLEVLSENTSVDVCTAVLHAENLRWEIDDIISKYTKSSALGKLAIKDLLKNPGALTKRIATQLDKLPATKAGTQITAKIGKDQELPGKIRQFEKHARAYQKGKFYVVRYTNQKGQPAERYLENIGAIAELLYRNHKVAQQKDKPVEDFLWVFNAGGKFGSYQAMPAPGQVYVLEQGTAINKKTREYKYHIRLHRTKTDFDKLGTVEGRENAQNFCEEHYYKKFKQKSPLARKGTAGIERN